MSRHIRKLNRPLFALPESHPARVFLEAFIECRKNCVGKEIEFPGCVAIDQKWHSETDHREWEFSAIAYMYLSIDIELDGWLTNPSQLTEGERSTLEKLRYLRTLMRECRAAALKDRNIDMIFMTSEVEETLDLWQICIETRADNLASRG